MALKATIFKADLNIADMDRHYYQDHALTIAQHPSETEERLMVRLLAFALHAHEALTFGKGLSTEDEPDLWLKDLSGTIELWIDVGLPDERRIRKACGRAKQVIIYSFGGHGADLWWDKNCKAFERIRNLSVYNLPVATGQSLAKLAQRNMQLQCTIQDGDVWLGDNDNRVEMAVTALLTRESSVR